MNWRDGYIAVDWGTTNRRAYAVDAGGKVVASFEDALGLLAVPPGGFEAAAAQIIARLGNRPLLLAGMVGSNRGWRETAYVPCPTGADELAARLLWISPGQTAIVPGVSQAGSASADVMRGEETQVLGAVAAGLVPPDCLICHPGTHTKWIRMEGGRIAAFRTMMTGELFSLLSTHSILAAQLDGEATPGPTFRRAARGVLDGAELLAELFGVRAKFLLGESSGDGASVASGLLIGSDVRAGVTMAADGAPIVLMGRADLRALYAAALAEAGRETIEVDGAEAFLAGMQLLVEKMG